MMKRTLTAALLAALWTGATRADDLAWLDDYNVVWTTPSRNSGESMPVGGHDIGLNVWVEDGEVLFYLTQAGCRDENGALLKHGRVRLSLDPNPLVAGGAFRQELKLRKSCIEITGQADGAPKTTVRVWVEVDRPVVHVEIDADAPVVTRAAMETWRYRDLELPQGRGKYAQRSMAMMNRDEFPGEVWLCQDTVEPGPQSVTWFHRMRNDRGVFEQSVRQQGLEAVRDRLYDPLTNLTFGGLLEGEELRADGVGEGVYAQSSFKAWRYRSQEPARRHRLRLVCHIDQTETIEQWKEGLQKLAAAGRPSHEEARRRRLEWWGSFWRRSHIVVNPGAGSGDRPWQVGRNYTLARYMLACNHAGREPTMFNGGLFTYDPLYIPGPAAQSGPDAIDQGWTPDHRQWGAGFTSQNQRLMYWTMLRTGDFDVMRPGLDFYRLGLASAAARVKAYWGHEGACFVEQISAQALPGLAMWGHAEGGRRGRPENLEHGVQVNMATRYLYQAQLEFAYMAIQYHSYSGNDLRPYLPFIDAAVTFYDRHYRMRKLERDGEELDEDGHLVITPSLASECYGQGGKAVNPADAVAGLHAVLEGLLGLSDELVPAPKKAEYAQMLSRVPPIPVAEMDGQTVFAPAANLRIGEGVGGPNETPELYRVFPYDRAGLGLGDVDMARRTWARAPRRARGNHGWHQGVIFCARLGLVEEASHRVTAKLQDAGRKFPAFIGDTFNWVPDNDWLSTGMIGLQEMLVQSHDGTIWLLPAWPQGWDVDFRLHAPHQTVVEGSVRDGKLVSWYVTPEARKGDVKIVGAK